jgi:hypothetical protein
MLNSEQLNELHNSRKARTEKEEKRRKKRLNKKVRQLEKSNKKREIEIKKCWAEYQKHIDPLKNAKTRENTVPLI